MKLLIQSVAHGFRRTVRALVFATLGPIATLVGLVSTLAGSEVNVVFDTMIGKEARVEAAVNGVPTFGFLPLMVSTENRQARELEWTLNSKWTSHWLRSVESQQVLRIPAQRASTHWVFVPANGSGSTADFDMATLQFGLSGSGVRSELKTVTINGGNPPERMAPWAVSTALAENVRRAISEITIERSGGGRSGGGTGGVDTTNLNVFDPALPRGDWRAWSPLARVFLRTSELNALDAGTRAALRSWVALGGWLYLVPESSVSPTVERLGAGAIVRLGAPLTGTGVPLQAGLSWRDGVLESTLAQPSEGNLSLGSSGLAGLVPGAKPAGTWLTLFFVVFAILVGPVNLFFFAPRPRRSRLFWTVPAMSLGAVLLLVGMIFLQDGVGGTGVRRALVVLLPGENQAAVFQDQISRTGFLFSSSFALPDDTLCAQVPLGAPTHDREKLDYNRAAGQADGSFFRNRARQGQHLRRLTPTRGRVERVGTGAGGAPVVQSSVGATLTNFHYYDAGVLWTAKSVAPGVRVVLEKAPHAVPEQWARDASPVFQQLFKAAVRPEISGTFVAEASASELAPLPTLDSIDWVDSKVVITGRAEVAGSAAVEKGAL